MVEFFFAFKVEKTMVLLSGVLPFCSCCYLYKIIIFLYLLQSYLLLLFLCFVLLLGFLGQNVCMEVFGVKCACFDIGTTGNNFMVTDR